MKPLLSLPGMKPRAGIACDENGYRADGKIEVDVRSWRKGTAVADEDVDEKAARRALGVDEWRARRRGGGGDAD